MRWKMWSGWPTGWPRRDPSRASALPPWPPFAAVSLVESAFPARAWERRGPETILTGTLDQPGLYGVLAEIEALGLDLLEVRQLSHGTHPPDRGDPC